MAQDDVSFGFFRLYYLPNSGQVLQMPDFQLFSPSDQVAHYLRRLLNQGRWTSYMPGTVALSKSLPGVDRKTIGTALQKLVKEGWLEDQGIGKKRKIIKQTQIRGNQLFRVGYLPHATDGDHRLHSKLLNRFTNWKGVIMEPAPKGMVDLNRNLNKISSMVLAMEMDAWIVPAGSREILQWFKDSGLPVYAVFGRHWTLKMDGFSFDASAGVKALAERILSLGHKKICWIARKEHRQPELGKNERVFFETLSSSGITPGPFTLPDWEETPDGFQKLMDSLFRVTPPTVLILPETYLIQTVFQYFSTRGIRVPYQVSVVCTEDCVEFNWASPPITRISKDFDHACQAICDWVEIVSNGRTSPLKKTIGEAEFILGGTLVKASR